MSEQSAKKPLIDPTELGAMTTSRSVKRNSTGDMNFGDVLAKGISLMMKGSSLSTMTAMDGSFSLDKVPPGTYYVLPQFAGYLSPIGELSQMERMAANDATIAAVESTAQKIVVQPNATVSVENSARSWRRD
jgi:hypothetical protein